MGLAACGSSGGDGSSGSPSAGATARAARLVIDVADDDGLPKRFRTSADLPGMFQGTDLRGLDTLRAAGSAAPSARGLAAVAHRLSGRVVDVDLRQETHLLVNGMGVSWFGDHDDANLGLGHDQVLAAEQRARAKLAQAGPVTFDYLPGKSVRPGGPVGDPRQVRTEREAATAAGLDYLRLTVPDHHRPQNEEVDRFVTFVRGLRPSTWLYFHCRGGKGRTTTLMAMYDMLRNARQVSFADILHRQQLIGGVDLLGGDDTSGRPAAEREKFLRSFYTYAAGNRDGFATPYGKWSARSES
ncbi:hypothetical protein ACIHFE_32200 [Streptomyces sp. NPDC052396]|uniref:phosphatase domain-containing protein n=1 Tax=Streptomyces sp. NPDC052396 TaxID=3365689 RepID=UPI0037D44CD3